MVGVMGLNDELGHVALKDPGAEVTEAAFNPEAVTKAVASARVSPVRSGMA
jgi:hypothetical protein